MAILLSSLVRHSKSNSYCVALYLAQTIVIANEVIFIHLLFSVTKYLKVKNTLILLHIIFFCTCTSIILASFFIVCDSDFLSWSKNRKTKFQRKDQISISKIFCAHKKARKSSFYLLGGDLQLGLKKLENVNKFFHKIC